MSTLGTMLILLKEIHRILRPGGAIEVLEYGMHVVRYTY
jgi:hypothetical protein